MIDFRNQSVLRTIVGATGTILCASLCLIGATAPANAGEIVHSRTVSYADLNLSTPAGRAILDRRVDQAAHAVCNAGGSVELAEWVAASRCVKQAKASAAINTAALFAKVAG